MTLVDQLRIVDRRQSNLVPVSQNPTQLRPRRRNAARHNQRRPSEIDEADFATVDESPPPPKIRRTVSRPRPEILQSFAALITHILRDARLRDLERDGLVSRTVFATTPPQVEYALTGLGRSVADPLRQIREWSVGHMDEIEAARAAYDQRQASPAVVPNSSSR